MIDQKPLTTIHYRKDDKGKVFTRMTECEHQYVILSRL